MRVHMRVLEVCISAGMVCCDCVLVGRERLYARLLGKGNILHGA